MQDTQEILDTRELISDLSNRPYRMFSDEHQDRIIQSYKKAPIDEFNQGEIDDLRIMNSKHGICISWITEEGLVAKKGVLNFGLCSVGIKTKIKKQLMNSLQATPIRITDIIFDSDERITSAFPVSSIQPGEIVSVEFVWRPLLNRKKALNDCTSMVLIEPEFSKRVEWAMADA